MKRRILLASLATIPSGAAQAMASSAQCLINEMASDELPVRAVPLYAADEYLRLPCVARRWWDVQQAMEVLSFEVEKLEYFADGTDFTPAGLKPLNWETGEKTQDALCLAVFLPDEQMTEIAYLGVWPKEQIGADTTPMTHSCLTSFL